MLNYHIDTLRSGMEGRGTRGIKRQICRIATAAYSAW